MLAAALLERLGLSTESISETRESRNAADEKTEAIIAELPAGRMSKAADLIEQTVLATLIYRAFPDIHWQQLRNNNPLD
jgi:putative transposase